MGIDFGKFRENIRFLVTYYIETFVGILVSPSLTFQALLGSQNKEKYRLIRASKFDERPIVFAGISLLIGLLLGKSLSIKDAPPDVTSQTIVSTVIPTLFVWLLYGISIHLCARWLGGKGKVVQTIAGVFYVLGVLHPLLLFFIYLLSIIFPGVLLSYDLTWDYLGAKVGYVKSYQFNILGFHLQTFYYSVSTILSMIYLYFPLSIVHNLGPFRIVMLYVVGIVALFAFAIISVFGFVILWYLFVIVCSFLA